MREGPCSNPQISILEHDRETAMLAATNTCLLWAQKSDAEAISTFEYPAPNAGSQFVRVSHKISQ